MKPAVFRTDRFFFNNDCTPFCTENQRTLLKSGVQNVKIMSGFGKEPDNKETETAGEKTVLRLMIIKGRKYRPDKKRQVRECPLKS